tara:strand:+ start:89 stop:712 length:624 start_codon:yes stop_codon:yes gene_type:complete
MQNSSRPKKTCSRCVRLVNFREANKTKQPTWFNGAVPSFGSLDSELLIVGLAPGLQGANKTGRPFTGDYAGKVLYRALIEHGWAQGVYDDQVLSNLKMHGARITNAVRCVPPQNKPNAYEVNQCNDFLAKEIKALPNLETIIALGRLAHQAILKSLQLKQSLYLFNHGTTHKLSTNIKLIDSYHCSRYNINTRRLTYEMFNKIFSQV